MEKLQEKLLEFQKRVQAIKKDGTNPHFKTTYATLTQIISEVKPILSELGIVLTQPLADGYVITTLTCGTERVESSLPLPVTLNPQQMGSAITYYRRYTLASLLALEVEDDDAEGTMKRQEKNQIKVEPEVKKPFLNRGTENFNKCLAALKNGKGTIEQVESKYILSDEVKAELINQSKKA
jgi:hypothetical protein